jgi:hypothetical protein
MKLYILIEDSRSFYDILPHWLKILLPSYAHVRTVNDMTQNSYVLFSGHGYPGLIGINPSRPEKNRLGDAIQTVADNNIDMLILCLDADDSGVECRREQIRGRIESYPIKNRCRYEILVLNKCTETLLLGNVKAYPRVPSANFAPFCEHYNVGRFDPEDMKKPDSFMKSSSVYHEKYLKAMLRESRVTYTKSNPPGIVKKRSYFNALLKRAETTGHLSSFRNFVDFFDGLCI